MSNCISRLDQVARATRSALSSSLLAAWAVQVGCSTGPPPPVRPFDTIVTCDGENFSLDYEDRILQLDRDSDGAFTSADLAPGESAMILGVTYEGTGTQQPASNGFSGYSDWNAYLVPRDSDRGALRERYDLHLAVACGPTAQVTLGMERASDDPPGVYELVDYSFDAVDQAVRTTADVHLDGTVTIEEAKPGLTGKLDGVARGALYADFPEEVDFTGPTGTTIEVVALAFRELKVAP